MDTIGHELVKRRFAKTLQQGRLASTYLFVGPEGVGKRRFAEDLAATLLCTASGAAAELRPCGRCESCGLIATGAHPDRLLVERPDGKSSLPIELFVGRAEHRNREGLCHDIGIKPYLSSRRVAIIDDADLLGVESANSLLKTLEEPPPRSLLILIGTSLSKQLPTIRSRSQIVRFDKLTAEEVAEVLQRNGLVNEEHDPRSLAEASGGSVAGALAAMDSQIAAFHEQVVQTLGGGAFDPIRFAAAVIENANGGGADAPLRRERLKRIIGAAIDHYRSQVRRQVRQHGTSEPRLLDLIDKCLEAAEAVDRNANQGTLVQTWLVGLSRCG